MSAAKPSNIKSQSPMHPTQQSLSSPQLSHDDEKTWNNYIKNLYNKPEHTFRPKKGKDYSLSDSLDLHGLTIQQAFNTTRQFLEEHRINGSRSAIVITGKGGKISDEFPAWIENLGYVRKCEPILDSTGDFGAYLISLYAQR
jgi:DNA-nicking Smr family endonuclease